MPAPHIGVIGGGLAGLSTSIALADAGCRISLFERAPRLGGRATSYVLPDDRQIDNCQHVTLRCCTNLADFYSRVGVSDQIHFYDTLLFADSTGRRGQMRPAGLPAPLHLMPSFVTFPLLKWRDKHAIAHAMIRIVWSGGKPKLPDRMTMLDWLRAAGQTPGAIERFWKTVLVSALNEELDRIDARYGIELFWKAFLSNGAGFIMGIPSVPLADLYAACGERISHTGGTVQTRRSVTEINFSDGQVSGVKLDDGSVISADYYVSAVTFERLGKLLPDAPASQDLFAGLQQLHVSPITGVHLWFDRSVMSEPFLTSVDQTIQWIFNKKSGEHLQIVISASRNLSSLSQQEIAELCLQELTALLPPAREAKLLRFVVVRENAATFSPEPGCDRWRPPQKTPVPNFFLAGDWTQTGWPATMEGAVRSGYLAAEAVLKAAGRPANILRPDLPATGFARWFARL